VSTTVQYEIEIEIEIEPSERGAIEARLREALDNASGDPPAGFRPNEADWYGDHVTFVGSESDWTRSHEDRHRAVCAAIATVLPTARVQSRWLDDDFECDGWEAFDSDHDD
jgi:hypothetical protein